MTQKVNFQATKYTISTPTHSGWEVELYGPLQGFNWCFSILGRNRFLHFFHLLNKRDKYYSVQNVTFGIHIFFLIYCHLIPLILVLYFVSFFRSFFLSFFLPFIFLFFISFFISFFLSFFLSLCYSFFFCCYFSFFHIFFILSFFLFSFFLSLSIFFLLLFFLFLKLLMQYKTVWF